MVLLFDENISFRIVKKLAEIYPKCLHVTDVSPSIKGDEKIFQYAKQHEYVIVTFDEDFYDLQSLRGFPPKVMVTHWKHLNIKSYQEILSGN